MHLLITNPFVITESANNGECN